MAGAFRDVYNGYTGCRRVDKRCQCRKLRVTARSQVREFSDLGVIAMPSDDSRGNATGHRVR